MAAVRLFRVHSHSAGHGSFLKTGNYKLMISQTKLATYAMAFSGRADLCCGINKPSNLVRIAGHDVI